jgi:hypothetical protein
MQPSKENVAEFLSFAPGADEGTAFMFLEVPLTMVKAMSGLLTMSKVHKHHQ